MEQNVGRAVIGYDEAVSFCDVEPFDASGDLDEIELFFAFSGRTGA